MCNRDVLPVFNSIYKFIAANYRQGAPLWPTARAELVAFRGLMPLLRGDWALPWSPLVCLSDASEHGYAVCASIFEPDTVKEIGRVQERSRFRRLGGHSARAHFFAMNGIVMTSEGSLKPVSELEETDDITPQVEWGVDKTFKEMAAEIFSGSRWTELVARGWRNTTEDILVYESRALLRAIEIQFSLSPREGEHAVAMTDNLPAVLCFERRRAKNFVVLSCIRRAVALCLALNKRLHVRWVPSELNPSDEGSRLYDPTYDPKKTLVNSWEFSGDQNKNAVNRRLAHLESKSSKTPNGSNYVKQMNIEQSKNIVADFMEQNSKYSNQQMNSNSSSSNSSSRAAPATTATCSTARPTGFPRGLEQQAPQGARAPQGPQLCRATFNRSLRRCCHLGSRKGPVCASRPPGARPRR